MPPALLAGSLGSGWDSLPEPVRRLHAPCVVDTVRTVLHIVAHEDRQEWIRDFSGFEMVTTQYVLSGQRLAERRGAIELVTYCGALEPQ